MTPSMTMLDILEKYVRIRPGNPFPGKVAHIWEKASQVVTQIVREEKLQALPIVAARKVAKPDAGVAQQENIFWWRPDGGWPLPHFHLGNKIYPATDQQWNRFSAQVLTNVGANLQNAKFQAKVSFDEFMEITQAAAKQL